MAKTSNMHKTWYMSTSSKHLLSNSAGNDQRWPEDCRYGQPTNSSMDESGCTPYYKRWSDDWFDSSPRIGLTGGLTVGLTGGYPDPCNCTCNWMEDCSRTWRRMEPARHTKDLQEGSLLEKKCQEAPFRIKLCKSQALQQESVSMKEHAKLKTSQSRV